MVKSGIIYKIYDQTDKKLVYYGSTEQSISERLGCHISDYKSYKNGNHHFVTSYLVFDADNYDIMMVERVEFGDIKELRNRERFYIENNICVNQCIPTRTEAEWREANAEKLKKNKAEYRKANVTKIKKKKAEWYQENKDKILEDQAQYYKANKDKILEDQAQYKKVNKVKIAEQNAERYQENKAKINEKFVCVCGGSYTNRDKSKHEKTKKHQLYLTSIQCDKK